MSITQSAMALPGGSDAPMTFAGGWRTAARLRVWRLCAWLHGNRNRRPSGGPGEPPDKDDPVAASHWDDPELWILLGMMH